MSLLGFIGKAADAVVATPIRFTKSAFHVVVNNAPPASILHEVKEGVKKDLAGISAEFSDITEKR